MNIKQILKKEWYLLIVLSIPFILSAYFWDQLPAEMPTHFNSQGVADSYSSKMFGAFLFPALAVILYLSLIILPAIDPKKRIEANQKPIAAIRMVSSLTMVGIYAFIMAISLGAEINKELYLNIGIGILFFILGNYMNSVKPNYFIGVRTPWTLESPEVWKKTHRLSSRLWMAGGLALMVSPFIPRLSDSEYWMVAIILVLVGIPVIYSYLVFRQLQNQKDQ